MKELNSSKPKVKRKTMAQAYEELNKKRKRITLKKLSVEEIEAGRSNTWKYLF